MAKLVDAAAFKAEVLSGACRFEPGCGHHRNQKEKEMANAREQMKTVEVELARVRSEMERLKIEESVLLKLYNKMRGDNSQTKTRTRSPSVKPLVLDIMREAALAGATTAEVDERVRAKIPTVAKDTVGSILSRLKSDGALVYEGERYYDKKFTPRNPESPFDRTLRAVN